MKKTMSDLINSKKQFIGSFIQIPSVELVEMFSWAGMDFMIIDLEHGLMDRRTTLEMIKACENNGSVAMVRVPDVSEREIKRAFDMGASAIAVPGVKCYEDALKVVEYAKFNPEGSRGACPCVRANKYGMGHHIEYFAEQNRETKIFVGLEGPSAIADLDKIIKIDGIDILGVGPIDLSVAMGLGGAITKEVMAEAAKVKKAANANGKLYASFYRYIEDIEPIEEADLFLIAGVEFQLSKWISNMSKKIEEICG